MSGSPSPYRDFADNLRRLSLAKSSIAQVCRELGMNRQQFNKYLSGANLPGPVTLEKIARYFCVDSRSMFAWQDDTPRISPHQLPDLSVLSHGAVERLGPVLAASADCKFREGIYHAYFPWLRGNGEVVRSVIVVFKAGGHKFFRRYTRLTSSGERKLRFNHGRHDGIVLEISGRTYFLAQNTRGFGELSMLMIGPSAPASLGSLVGLALLLGLSEPLATRTTLEYFGNQNSFRKALGMCRILPENAPDIPQSLKPTSSDREQNSRAFVVPFGLYDSLGA